MSDSGGQQSFSDDDDRSDADRRSDAADRIRERAGVDRAPPPDRHRCRVLREYDFRRCPHWRSDSSDEPVCALHAHTVTYRLIDEVKDQNLIRPDLDHSPPEE